MPDSANPQLPPVGSPEYYEHMRQMMANFANSAGSPVDIRAVDQQAKPHLIGSPVTRQEFTAPPQTPAASTAEDPYAPTAWSAEIEEDFKCPSGQLCRVRKVDIVDLLGGGLLNKLDVFTAVANENTPDAKKEKAAKTAAEALSSKEGVDNFRQVMNSVVRRVVVKPELWADPAPGEERVEGCIYVSSVSFNDRTAIFNWAVTGQKTEEIKRFRDEAVEPVGTVEHGEVLPDPAVNVPGDQSAT